MAIDKPLPPGLIRPYAPDDYEAASELLGDTRPLAAPDAHVQFVDYGVALWLDPHPGGDEAYLGPVITPELEPGLLTYQLVLVCAEDALAMGHRRAYFTIKHRAVLRVLERTFRIEPVAAGWDPRDGTPREWQVHVDIADAVEQLRDVIDSLSRLD